MNTGAFEVSGPLLQMQKSLYQKPMKSRIPKSSRTVLEQKRERNILPRTPVVAEITASYRHLPFVSPHVHSMVVRHSNAAKSNGGEQSRHTIDNIKSRSILTRH